MLLANSLQALKPSSTLKVAQQVKELTAKGKQIIDLGVGEPCFDTPQIIKNAALEAINNNLTKYPPVRGVDALIRAIINKFNRQFNITNLQENNIIVTTGCKQAIFNALMATLNPQDEVIIFAPYWVSYVDMVNYLGGVPVIINTMDNNLKLDFKKIQASLTPKTKWIIINSPNNPSGVVYSEHDLKNFNSLLKDNPQLNILSDDIYGDIRFNINTNYNLLTLCSNYAQQILICHGVSKEYAMTGWRIGYALGNSTIISAMLNLQSQSTTGACTIAQYAAAQALNLESTNKIVKQRTQILYEKQQLVIKNLEPTKLTLDYSPQGAFYLLLNLKNYINKCFNNQPITSALQVAQLLLEHAQVAVIPGCAFGATNGQFHQFIRISYANSNENLLQGLNNIAQFYNKLS